MVDTLTDTQTSSVTPAPQPSGGTSSSGSHVQMRRALQAKSFGDQAAMLEPHDAAAPVAAPVQQRAVPGPVQLKPARSVQRMAAGDVVQRDAAPPGGPPPAGNAPANNAPGSQTNAPAATPPVDPAAEERSRKQEMQGVTNPPIAQASDDPPASLGQDGKSLDNMKSDSPDPILVKNRLIAQTTAYLALQNPEPAVKQAKLDEIKATFEELRAAMKHARGEENALTALRVQFESFLGQKATNEWTQGTACVDTMVGTAKSMIAAQEAPAAAAGGNVDATLAGLPPDVKARIGQKIGAPINMGFAGTVGTSFAAIIQALEQGSLVQKAQGLIGFTDGYLVPGLLSGSGAVFDQAKANLQNVQPQLDLAKLVAEAKTMDKKKARAHLLTSPVFREKLGAAGASSAGANAQRTQQNGAPLAADATLNGMDTKMAAVPVEILSETQLDFLAGSIDTSKYGNFKLDEYRAKRGKDEKVAYLKGAGITTSKPDGAHVDATSTVEGEDGITVDQLNGLEQENYAYIEGKLENIVDPKNQWIMDANQAQMPLKAGISGTTARFVGAANLLGGNMNGAVVAMLGHLQAIEAHSFWEIVDAAGLGMSAGKYVPFPPNDGGMRSAATEFIAQNGFGQLGPMDKSNAEKVLLGEKGQAG